ncbi:L-rhamnose isomerase [Pelolinea submarina]|uniref:L-rhamnose isomerase n=1 Tax=Pelolinea submarina TaxID=913107 RepID=A0A347ZPI8_9CHLR|nr:L-rhamnose isomerase [Pelolinea submarina]REG04766.1 L-rhamnose isomerase [Pelolinea submarina]BBB47219.1 L-rhamnose isomerase [Pelolinea submarina]
MPTEQNIQSAYELAKARYADFGVDTGSALQALEKIAISLHCWQGDDASGYENPDGELTGGIAVTGNYPGKARTADQLRADLDLAYSLIPGTHRLNLHSIYWESDQKVPRNAILPEHFSGWVDWAKANHHGMDFNPTCFSHPMADDGFTLSSRDAGVRQFWIEHCIACRKIGDYFGRELGTPAVTNIWIPDGYKDTPADRTTPRRLLMEALDVILAEKLEHNLDAVEPKLFGIGSESYVTGSMEFYTAYALTRKVLLTLDSGHFHPTETIADKISSLMLFLDQMLLHVSRGVRWDSDHVVTYTEDLQAIAREVVRLDALERMHIGLDYFDASINRIAAWTIGSRNTLRALLNALLEPCQMLEDYEASGDFTSRLALQEEIKVLPANAVWDFYCLKQGVPVGMAFMDSIRDYEERVLSKR